MRLLSVWRMGILRGCGKILCKGIALAPPATASRVWCRYQELQKLLGVENIEKAQLLMQAADYTRQLQVGCECTFASHQRTTIVLSFTPIQAAAYDIGLRHKDHYCDMCDEFSAA